jgi:hypothetical protein
MIKSKQIKNYSKNETIDPKAPYTPEPQPPLIPSCGWT